LPDLSTHWDQLHGSERFRPRYPNDHVVRFLMANRTVLDSGIGNRFLDIGAGAGRHMRLASETGFEPYGVDTSLVGLRHTNQLIRDLRLSSRAVQASMLALPFADQSFAVVLSFGVFCYGTVDEMQRAIGEAQRVLAANGRMFAVLRSTDDYRFGRGERLAENTFRLNITETNECNTVQHFLCANDIPEYFKSFSQVGFEKTETSTANRTRVDSDWLITAKK